MSGKQEMRGDVSTSLISMLSHKVLSTRKVNINVVTKVLVELGCLRGIVHLSLCPWAWWSKRQISMRSEECEGEKYQ